MSAPKDLPYHTKIAAYQDLMSREAVTWRQEYFAAEDADAANKHIKISDADTFRALIEFQHSLAESAVPLWFWQEGRCGKLAQKVPAFALVCAVCCIPAVPTILHQCTMVHSPYIPMLLSIQQHRASVSRT